MGKKGGGGGRVGYGAAASKGVKRPTSRGPKSLGGKHGAGGKVGGGGGTLAALERAAGGDSKGANVSLANFQRQARVGEAEALAEADKLVDAGKARFTFLSEKVAATLRAHGKSVPERGGRPVKGLTVVGSLA